MAAYRVALKHGFKDEFFMNQIVIEMQDLGKRFGHQWVLSHVNLTIRAGESVALFGRNGSGKSTLLRIISTLLGATRGRCQVLGFDVGKERGEVRRQLCLLSHSKQLYGNLTVWENLRLVAGIRGLPEKTLSDPVQRLDLAGVRDQKVADLSEGMKKRVVLARLLLANDTARMILLDEPYPSLDSYGRETLDALIRDWKREGKTILLASHDHELALAHVDRLIVLEAGKVKYDGLPKRIEEIP